MGLEEGCIKLEESGYGEGLGLVGLEVCTLHCTPFSIIVVIRSSVRELVLLVGRGLGCCQGSSPLGFMRLKSPLTIGRSARSSKSSKCRSC